MSSNSSSETLVKKFKIGNNTYYTKILWKPDDKDLFQFKIYDGENSWSGSFTLNEAEGFTKLLRKEGEEYYSDVKSCLKEQNSDYIYEFSKKEGESDVAIFNWSKPFEDVNIPLCSISLKLDNIAESKDTLLDFLINENEELKQGIELYSNKAKDMESEVTKCRQEMETFARMKDSMKEELYARFIQLLNEKKRRIVILEESLQLL